MGKAYIVTGYYRTLKYMRVVADSEQEAIEKAKAGEYEILDSDPEGDIYTPKWKAQEE